MFVSQVSLSDDNLISRNDRSSETAISTDGQPMFVDGTNTGGEGFHMSAFDVSVLEEEVDDQEVVIPQRIDPLVLAQAPKQ